MIQAIAFDLDDTLLDTTQLLLGAAAERACRVMIQEGLSVSLDQCLLWRKELAPQKSHKELFFDIALRAGGEKARQIGSAGVQAFYESPIPETLPLLSGAAEVLQALSGRYALFLVTSGAPATQWEKVRATGLEGRFQEIFVVDKMRGEQKTASFQAILKSTGLQPQALLSVGNRLTEEIRLAKRLGAQTCHFEYGEHVGEQVEFPEDHADFTIHSWPEFIPTCRL